MNHKDINKLETELVSFVDNWQKTQKKRVDNWRKLLLGAFFGILFLVYLLPESYQLLWGLSIMLIGFSAGALFKMISDDAKCSRQIVEHKKQLEIARALVSIAIE